LKNPPKLLRDMQNTPTAKPSIRCPRLVLLCVAAVGLVSCAHSLPPAAAALPDYGTAGAGKIQVTIGGDVRHPGTYWIPESSNLVTVQEVFGGWGGHGDFGGVATPHHVILIRVVDGQRLRTKYRLNVPPYKKAAIPLKDGDTLVYPAVVF